MELALFVYLASFVNRLGILFSTTTIIGSIGIVAYLLFISFYVSIENKPFNLFYKTLRNSCIAVFCLGFFTITIPSEKTMYMMAGAYATQSVVQSETMQKVVDIINLKLDEELAKVKPKE